MSHWKNALKLVSPPKSVQTSLTTLELNVMILLAHSCTFINSKGHWAARTVIQRSGCSFPPVCEYSD